MDVDMDIDELDQIKQDVARVHDEHVKKDPVFQDKILNQLMVQNVYINEFT